VLVFYKLRFPTLL